jgi:two-component system sensor histidine kinase HydH
VVAVVALLGGALLATAWSTWAAVRDASSTLLRGQAVAFQQSVRARIAELEGVPTAEELAVLLEEEREAGLRFVALVDRRGEVVAQAGEPVGGSLPLRQWGPPGGGPPPGEQLELVDGRVRTLFGVRARLGDGGGGGGGRGEAGGGLRPQRGGRLGLMVLEFEPVEARALRGAATRTFRVGALAALLLLVTAVALVRRVLRQEALEREAERAKRLASLGEMSAVLAHEIRNPLASLKGNAQLLAAMLPEGERPRAKAERVVSEAERLEALTNDLLSFVRGGDARGAPGEPVLRRAEVDPAALLRESAASVSAEHIAVEAAGAPALFALDGPRVRQVLVNLLENAVQAGPPVLARVTASGGGGLLFEVQDRGPGVAPEDRERIFEPFFTRRTQGTGLGLAVARRVVDLHGGTLTVGEAPGGGASFRVVLPASAQGS